MASATPPRITEDDLSRMFIKADIDRNGALGIGDVMAVMHAIGQDTTEAEAIEMLRIASADGTGELTYNKFRAFVCEKILGISLKELEARPVLKENGKPAVVVPRLQLSEAGIMKKGQGSGKPEQVAREDGPLPPLQPLGQAASPRTRLQLRTDMMAFNEKYAVSLDKIENISWKIEHKEPKDTPPRMDFSTFLLEFGAPDSVLARNIFCVFFDGKGVPVRLLSIALASVLSTADVDTKIKFAFATCDMEEKGVITVDDLVDILRANHFTLDAKEVSRKATLIMTAARAEKTIAYKDFFTVCKRFPNVVFPVLEMK